MALERAHPFVGPPVDLAGLHHGESLEFLRALGETVALGGIVLHGEKRLVYGVGSASVEAEARRVADVGKFSEPSLAALDPVVNDAEFAGLVIEEFVKRTGNQEVDVEKERRTFEISESVFKKAKFNEDIRPLPSDNMRIVGERNSFDAVVQSRRIVGHADEAEGTRQIALNARIEAVHVFGTVVGSPFEAKDVDRFFFHKIVSGLR